MMVLWPILGVKKLIFKNQKNDRYKVIDRSAKYWSNICVNFFRICQFFDMFVKYEKGS